eukprot:SM000104S09325  [mRNA]  locus=s104:124083:125362:+ [translate_table: standard]
MLPAGGGHGPNPHHESEKLMPAALLASELAAAAMGANASAGRAAGPQALPVPLFWLADPRPASFLSAWAHGLLAAFVAANNGTLLRAEFLSVLPPGPPAVCFEDVVLLAGITSGRFVPDRRSADWLRALVLAHCGIDDGPPTTATGAAPRRAVLVVREGVFPRPPRSIINAADVGRAVEAAFGVPLDAVVAGHGSMCDQVRSVANADLILTPHGSQNVNLLFAPRGAAVVEIFPFLYHAPFLHNYLCTANVYHHELFGSWSPLGGGGPLMPLALRAYALALGWRRCFHWRHCMNLAKRQDIFVDIPQLKHLLSSLAVKPIMQAPDV